MDICHLYPPPPTSSQNVAKKTLTVDVALCSPNHLPSCSVAQAPGGCAGGGGHSVVGRECEEEAGGGIVKSR
jgi:hypothetical protein